MNHPTNLQSSPDNPLTRGKPIPGGIHLRLSAVRPLDWAAAFALVLICIPFFAGLPSVPFHPDESTQVFMSSDFEGIFQNPSKLFWSGSPVDPVSQTYRELDAPITRDLIGLGRFINQSPGQLSNWDWSKTWAENQAAGALPDPALLLTARLSIAWLFPAALLFIYLSCRIAGYPVAGFISLVILGINPILLLHTRRAMAEGILFFCIALVLFLISYHRTRAFLLGAGLGFAICAKQSAAGLLPAGALASLLAIPRAIISFRRIALVLGEISVGLLLVYGLLNPFLWSDPIGALRDAAAKRENLRSQQIVDFGLPAISPERSVGSQLVLLIGEMSLVPPQFEEAGNYSAIILPQKITYSNQPLNLLLTGPVWAGIFLFLVLVGIVFSILHFMHTTPDRRAWLAILAVATLGEFAFLSIALPLPFQRYTVPLFPLVGIWAGLGVESVLGIFPAIKKASPGMTKPGEASHQ